MAFAVSSFMSTALLGAVMTFMWTGHGPTTVKDYFHPPDATGQRHTIPGYPDQIINFAHAPVQTALNKVAPIWSALGQAVQNQDFQHTEIRHPDDPALQQLGELALWAAKQPIPFSVTSAGRLLESRGAETNLTSMLHEALKHPEDIALGQLGFQPSPRWIQDSEAITKAHEYAMQNRPPGTKTQDQEKRYKAMSAIVNMYRNHELDQDQVNRYKSEGLIDEADMHTARSEAKEHPIERATKSLNINQVLNVWEVATMEEKKELRHVLRDKAPEIHDTTSLTQREKLREAYKKAMNENLNQPVVVATAKGGGGQG